MGDSNEYMFIYVLSTFSSAKNIFENRSGFNFFFSRETAARDELINEESLRAQRLLNTISLANYLV